MRQSGLIVLCIAGALGLSACEKSGEVQVSRAMSDLNVVDESNLNDVMLTVADPNEAVSYFNRAVESDPSRIDLQRGLASSLVRARRPQESVPVWRLIVASDEASNDDRVDLADALIRANDWPAAEVVLDSVPPTHETFKRYRLEAMIADSNEEWQKSDSFYEIAIGLTTKPAGVLNNWGYSKLTRSDYVGAERLFFDAIRYDSQLFTAKNNLVLARAARRVYEMPVIDMTQIERAQLLHTMALAAIKQGDINIGKGLLQEAIETHPQHFEAAVRALRALESNVIN